MASARIQTPERYGASGVDNLIHDDLQHVGAVRDLLAGVRGFEHSHLNVRDVRCAGPGVELRVGYFGDPTLRSQMMPDIESARVSGQSWLDATRAAAKGAAKDERL